MEFSLREQLFSRERVVFLAGLFRAAGEGFDSAAFVRQVVARFPKLGLKERIVHIASVLEGHLSADFRVAAGQILAALPPPLDPSRTDNDFGDFIFAPLGEFVVRRGMDRKHLKLSFSVLRELTQRFSMEDAIRSFINVYPSETLCELERWAGDGNYHVRRLVSEGTRARLPWSARISIDVEVPVPLLDRLHADRTRYVTRSVSNHLNDLSRQRPGLVLEILGRWRLSALQNSAELDWMSRHALRTLVKQGHPGALRFLGFRPNPRIRVSGFSVRPRKLKPGESIEISFSVTAGRRESLMVDYVIDFVKSNGTRSPKVHKLKIVLLETGSRMTFTKRHLFHANATTYRLYPGIHRLSLQINGKQFGQRSFELVLS